MKALLKAAMMADQTAASKVSQKAASMDVHLVGMMAASLESSLVDPKVSQKAATKVCSTAATRAD